MAKYLHEILEKTALKPGFVLNQDVIEISGLKKGHVLSPEDIEALRLTPEVIRVSILRLDREIEEVEAESHKERSVSEKDFEKFERGLTQAPAAEEYAKRLEKALSVVRGTRYQQRVEKYRVAHFNHIEAMISTARGTLREKALDGINRLSEAAADLEGLERVRPRSGKEWATELEKVTKLTETLFENVVDSERIRPEAVRYLVFSVIESLGYQLSTGLLAFLHLHIQKSSFLFSHSVEVMMVSMVTAIELTRGSIELVESSENIDIHDFLEKSAEIYTLDDLMNLGMAALLHDIDFFRQYSELSESDQLEKKSDSIWELHASNGSHLVKKIGLDFDIYQAVYQHHERIDGSGFPRGIMSRLFSRYSKVLTFAEHYIESTTQNPFMTNILTPRDFLVRMLSEERHCFDSDTIFAFIRTASLYPVGSWVQMSDKRIGVVYDINPHSLDSPVIRVLYDEKLHPIVPETLDLTRSDSKIVRCIDALRSSRLRVHPALFA